MNFLKNKLLTIVLVLCLAFTVFIGITANKRENTGMFQGVVASVVTPVQKYIYLAGQRVGNMFYYIKSITTAHSENIKLKEDVIKLQRQLVEYDTYKRQNTELNELMKFKSGGELTTIGANVIGKTGENWFDILLIDVGAKDGVKKDQYVVTNKMLVGKVIEVYDNASKVLTILDERANIPSTISSTGENGIVSGVKAGSKERYTKMYYLSVESAAKEGDIVVTSNIIKDESIIVPDGMIIGTIQSVVDEKPNLEKAAVIKPAVDFSRLEKVLVITER